MPCKIYAHLDLEGRTPFSLPLQVQRPEDALFGNVKQALIQQYAQKFPDEEPVDYNKHCFWNEDRCAIADRSAVAVYVCEHNDFFLRALPEGAASESALKASQQKRGELSYYYAHNRKTASLVSKVPAAAAAAPPAAPREPLKNPVVTTAGKFNTKQSPFGTDISQYETITKYTWEDHDGDTVKVLVPLDDVGKLNPGQIRAHFGERQFELLVDNYKGKNLRFACNKTHGEMKPEDCKHVVRANRVNLVIKKAKEKDIWFDLFKKRAIGDDDDP
eukprot:TRINITY_DN14367_c0_g1_i2.p1 TRINITY_DN14367_c0_g1~~TRINITY_DN14367_c0_g1_i2.p1  ORF type:complete len:274 (-),score=76.17 TRINITY_DN14367_c0_g1_i2:252-1073(-)